MIRKFFLGLFADPRKDLAKIKSFLKSFHTEVSSVGQIDDPLLGLIKLYDAASKFEDMDLTSGLIKKFKGINLGQLTSCIETLETLQVSVKALGRDMKGKNRTVNGQTVTADCIYLPAISGSPVAMQLSHWINESKRNVAVENQAKNLILLHGRDILQAIEFLQRSSLTL